MPNGSMRYFAWLYTPAQHRDVIAALFVIESELRDTANAPHEVAHIRLQWWREEIDRLTKNNAQHPATRILQTHRTSSTDFSVLDGLVLSTAQDIAHSTYETDVELNQYLSNQGSLMKLATCYLSNSSSSQLLSAAGKLGEFIRLVETIRDLRTDVHQGRLYLPLSELDKLNIEYEALAPGEWPIIFIDWLKARCRRTLQQQQQLASKLTSAEKQALRPVLVLSQLHVQLLELIVSNPNQHTRKRIELGALAKLWTAWYTARRT
jgi:phytoene synthase